MEGTPINDTLHQSLLLHKTTTVQAQAQSKPPGYTNANTHNNYLFENAAAAKVNSYSTVHMNTSAAAVPSPVPVLPVRVNFNPASTASAASTITGGRSVNIPLLYPPSLEDVDHLPQQQQPSAADSNNEVDCYFYLDPLLYGYDNNACSCSDVYSDSSLVSDEQSTFTPSPTPSVLSDDDDGSHCYDSDPGSASDDTFADTDTDTNTVDADIALLLSGDDWLYD